MKFPQPNEVRKPTKTLSGVTPIAVMCKPKKCKHGTCLYCPSLNVPQSYTPKSPPVLRASLLKYDSYKQVISRLSAFKAMNHPIDKIELIVMGGNFLEYPTSYQYNFIKKCYDALNNKFSKNLGQAKKLNEKAEHRCIALCIETRPDSCNEQNIKKMLDWGTTRIEIGVQAIDDLIYKKVNRGHTVKDVINATKKLKNSGFKVGYHMMLALPGSNMKKDLKMFNQIFENQDFKPDQLKIYPCQVLKGAELETLYEKGLYKPYTKEQTQELIIKIMKIIPNYCRVMRIMREIPPDYLIAGTIRIDLRKGIDEQLKKENTKINEIRFREIGLITRDKLPKQKINQNLKLKITKYMASDGDEYFLEIINNNNILFGLCRLRIFNDNKQDNNQQIKNQQAIIRELHVYGQAINIGQKSKNKTQHMGLGKKLVSEAENIVKNNKINQLAIISGIGVRQYYKKLGYKLDKNKIYMIKNF
jgi:elongator complex protein 3